MSMLDRNKRSNNECIKSLAKNVPKLNSESSSKVGITTNTNYTIININNTTIIIGLNKTLHTVNRKNRQKMI